MTIKNYSNLLLLAASITLAGCQTTTTVPSQELTQHENIRTMQADIPDSDGDGVLDDIDECPETPPNVVVDIKGCPIEVDVGGLEMEFNGFFPPMSSQLPDIYDAVFVKVAESLNYYPKANVFIFGHAATNEIKKDALARNRALMVKNILALQHHIDAKRIRTYECSNKIIVTDTAFIDPSFEKLDLKNIEAKQRRATLMASSEVHDLENLEYVSYTRKYGEYAKHCELFE